MIPWKLIITIIIALILIFFVGNNWEFKSDISLIFFSFKDVPVVISLFGAFLTGLVVALPYAFKGGQKKKLIDRIEKKNKKKEQAELKKESAEVAQDQTKLLEKPVEKKKRKGLLKTQKAEETADEKTVSK